MPLLAPVTRATVPVSFAVIGDSPSNGVVDFWAGTSRVRPTELLLGAA
jgi:hypothetical protein